MLDWILVTCLTLYLIIYLSLEECMEGRNYARLDSVDVSHPALFFTISLSRGVCGGEELC
jgi:hypothetical protein